MNSCSFFLRGTTGLILILCFFLNGQYSDKNSLSVQEVVVEKTSLLATQLAHKSALKAIAQDTLRLYRQA